MRPIDADAFKKRLIKRRDEIAEERKYGWEWEYNGFNGAVLLAGSEAVENPVKPESYWIPVEKELPEVNEEGFSEYILLSFANADIPCVGRYEDGDFYNGDDEEPLSKFGLIVNAWMPYPKPYREEKQ